MGWSGPPALETPDLKKLDTNVNTEIATSTKRIPAAGRRAKPPKQVRTVRDMILKHLYDERVAQDQLALAWNCSQSTAKAVMAPKNKRPITAAKIDGLVSLLKLDEFDATELHRKAALEAGYRIDGQSIQDFR